MDPFIQNYLKAAMATSLAHDFNERAKIDRAAVAMGWGLTPPPDLISQAPLPPIQIHNHPAPRGLPLYAAILIILLSGLVASVSILGIVYWGRQLTAPQQFEVQWGNNQAPNLLPSVPGGK